MQEFDQRNSNTLLIECNCSFQHYIEFSFDTDPEKYGDLDEQAKEKVWKHFYISFINRKEGFWYKIKDCWNYLFTRHGEICYSGIGILSKDMDKIIEHFKKYQKL